MGSLESAASARERPYNILLIVTDQQAAGTLSCEGNRDVATPNLDALAADGLRFDRCYCTFPLCTPSRASLFTGMYPHQVGIEGNGQQIHPLFRRRELGTILEAAGYDCAYAGKWHLPEICLPDGEHGYRAIAPIGDPDLPAAVEAFLCEPRERPFFLVVAYDNPHNICEFSHGRPMPWGAVDIPSTEQCPNLPLNHGRTAFGAETYAELLSFSPLYNQFARYAEDDWRRYRYVYHRLIERVDESVGRVLRSVARRGYDHDTVVVFTSDHGDMQGAHGLGHKIALYEESIRVPLIIRHRVRLDGHRDGVVPGGTHEGSAVYPCEHAELRGRSLVEPDGAPREYLVVETNYRDGRLLNGRAVIGNEYKYAIYNHGKYREQLFNLEDDPGELRNLAVERRYAAIVERMRQELKCWMDETDDRFEGHYAFRRAGSRLPPRPGLDWEISREQRGLTP